MKSTVNQYQFEQAFRACGRFGGDNDNFSYEALQLLFEHFEEFEDESGEESELDPIAICCEFVEMTKAELLEQYEITFPLKVNILSEKEKEDIVQRHLEEHTTFVGKTDPSSYSKLKERTFVFLQY